MQKRSITAGIAAAALLSGLLPHSAAASSSGDSTCWDYKRKERRFAKKINAARDNADLGRLSLDPELSKVARKHAKEMVNKDELYHTPGGKLGKRVTNWVEIGENVGVGDAVGSLHKAFMDSAPHKANILGADFRHLGVGIASEDGRIWVTILVEAKSDPGTILNMPSC